MLVKNLTPVYNGYDSPFENISALTLYISSAATLRAREDLTSVKPLKRARWRRKGYNFKLFLEKTAYSATTIMECISDGQPVISIYRLLKIMKDAVFMTQSSEYEIPWCELNLRKAIGTSSRTTFNSQAGRNCT